MYQITMFMHATKKPASMYKYRGRFKSHKMKSSSDMLKIKSIIFLLCENLFEKVLTD